jgi:hypothetical protein
MQISGGKKLLCIVRSDGAIAHFELRVQGRNGLVAQFGKDFCQCLPQGRGIFAYALEEASSGASFPWAARRSCMAIMSRQR